MFATLGGGAAGSAAAKPKAVAPKSRPWVEKYRPKSVSDVEYQDEVVSVLKSAIQSGDVPHLLFYGPPGTGKTSAVLAAARDLFGPELMKKRVLELNASDERGIKVVREKVKSFAQVSAKSTGSKGAGKYPCPPFKIIILDEADSMTADAQSALRRTMETYSKVTRFCLICNYVSRIIEPLASRCAKFRFKPLSQDTLINRLEHIAAAEGVHISHGAKQAIMDVSGGDLRKAITYLQSAHRLRADPNAEIEAHEIVEMSSTVPDQVLERLMSAIADQGTSFDALISCVNDVVAEGYSASQLILQLFNMVVSSADFSDLVKADLALKLAEADKKLVDGADEKLQLLDVSSFAKERITRERNTMAV